MKTTKEKLLWAQLKPEINKICLISNIAIETTVAIS